MIYLIYGDEQYLIDEQIDAIIKNNSNSFVTKFDDSFSKESHVFEAMDECLNISLLQEKSLVLYKNPSFLISKEKEEINDKFIDYINNPNDLCDLVLYTSYSSFNSKLKTFKEANKNAEVKFIKKLDPKRFYELCDSEIEISKIIIDKSTKDLFIENCGQDLSVFYSGLENLKQFEGKITIQVLDQLTYASDDFNEFSLVNSLIDGKLNTSVKLIRKLQSDENSIFRLLSLIAGQLRYLYSVSYYQTIYNNDNDVMEATSTSHPYRLEMARKTLKKISPKNIMKLLYKLSSFDYKLKTDSSIDKKILLELFVSTLKV